MKGEIYEKRELEPFPPAMVVGRNPLNDPAESVCVKAWLVVNSFMFYLTGVGLALFLDLLLLAKPKKSTADWILAWWMLFVGLHLLTVAAFRMKIYPVLLGLDLPLPVVHGPFLFLYTRALTGRALSAKHVLLHFLMPLAFYIYLIPFMLLPADQKILVYQNRGAGYETFRAIRGIWIPVSGILYILMSLVALRRHRRRIVDEFSSVDKINLDWLQYLMIWLALIWVMVIFGNDNWVFGTAVVFLFFIGLFGIRQGVIFKYGDVRPSIVHIDALTEPTGKPKYEKSGLTPESAETLHRLLSDTMASGKYYLDSELSLVDLAERLGVVPNHLSQVINEREGKKFYDYINGLRVDEFKRVVRLPGSEKLTLFAIAQQCGFNSKSSFNRYFKKVTGQLPSEYMDAAMTLQN